MFSEDYYLERAMQVLEPIIENEYQMICCDPSCGYKSRRRTDKKYIEGLGYKHQAKTHHDLTLLNHRIKVDIYRFNMAPITVESRQAALAAEPPPF